MTGRPFSPARKPVDVRGSRVLTPRFRCRSPSFWSSDSEDDANYEGNLISARLPECREAGWDQGRWLACVASPTTPEQETCGRLSLGWLES
jgi:hypothetical protein